MDALVQSLAEALLAHGQTIVTAESCTGGLVGATLTEQPGSSAWFLGGIIAYANSLKSNLLGIPPALLEAHGAVSPDTARAMADGARSRTGADVAVALTGIAGPEGGTPAKPVGLVYIAVASPAGICVRDYHFTGSREDIRVAATRSALALALDYISPSP